jgi:hypothetical protein
MRPAKFRVPEIDTTVPPQDLERVLVKLDLLASFDTTAAYNGVAHKIRQADQAGTSALMINLERDEDATLLRALEHLHYEDGCRGELARLRDALLGWMGAATIHYDLELIPPRAIDADDFVSYTGEYRVGDLLPLKEGRLPRVVEVRASDQTTRAVLVCEVQDAPP